MTMVATFEPVESFTVAGRRVYVGPCPWENCHRTLSLGQTVSMGGRLLRVRGIEAFAKLSEPELGEPIGLILETNGGEPIDAALTTEPAA